VTSSDRLRASALIIVLAALISAARVEAAVRRQAAGDALVGRLATVEPIIRRLTVVPEGEASLVEIFVAEDGEVRQGERRLTLSELVIEVGRRVTIRYRLDADRRIATRVTVEAAGSTTPPAPATSPTPLHRAP
jgi:hypothetical protein